MVARTPGTYSRDACFVVNRRLTAPYALALQAGTQDADAVLARAARHLFLVPWRDRTLVGVWHSVVPRDPDAVGMSREELSGYIAEINACHPGYNLCESEVERVDFGLVPFGNAEDQGTARISFGKQSRLIDHRHSDGLFGLITSISVRYTVARLDAQRALDCAASQLQKRPAPARSSSTRLPGGEIDNFGAFARECERNRPSWLSQASAESLVSNFGTHMQRVLALADADPALRKCVPGTHVTYAEIACALRDEMAQTMSDIVFRRTELGTGGHPGETALKEAAAFMQQARGWTAKRTMDERRTVDQQFARYLASTEPLRRIA
jgi:glycerol-3-phosphate dehydrogenase